MNPKSHIIPTVVLYRLPSPGESSCWSSAGLCRGHNGWYLGGCKIAPGNSLCSGVKAPTYSPRMAQILANHCVMRFFTYIVIGAAPWKGVYMRGKAYLGVRTVRVHPVQICTPQIGSNPPQMTLKLIFGGLVSFQGWEIVPMAPSWFFSPQPKTNLMFPKVFDCVFGRALNDLQLL